MYPEDRVLVGVMPDPRDLAIAHGQHWYRVPAGRAVRGIYAEYVAFYFTGKFPPDQRWGVYYYARRTGHELVRRIDLFPDEPDHPRSREHYYKIQLAALQEKSPPIISARWRRITFIYTTWDRFVAAREINDLYSSDSQFVDRIYHALKREGILPERQVIINEAGNSYMVDLLIPCKKGKVMVASGDQRPGGALTLPEGDDRQALALVQEAIERQGGAVAVDFPL